MPEQSTPRGRVFLSYGHDSISTPLVKQIKEDLEKLGWQPWLDESEIKFTDDWRLKIAEGIYESQHVLAFLSKHSTRKPGVCRQEIAIAIGPKKGHVYTVLLEHPNEVTPPTIISQLQWLDMQEWFVKQQTDPADARKYYLSKFNQIVEVLERNAPFSGDIDALRAWLDPWDGTADQVAAERGFMGRRWLLDGVVQPPWWRPDDGNEDELPPGEIEQWRLSPEKSKVFWISAGPGWGKSAVASRLAHAARSHVLAVHFCRHDEPQTCDARKVVRTIAFQMATQLGDYRAALVRLLNQGILLHDLNAKELFTRLLGAPLGAEVGGGNDAEGRRFIVIDALDESVVDGHSDLVDLIFTEFPKLRSWLGLVVTSRPEWAVKSQLDFYGEKRQFERDSRNLDDLKCYVKRWLESLPLSQEQREQALTSVITASEGVFLYVLQLREVVTSGGFPVSQLTDPASLPNGLAGLYLQWFKHRFGKNLTIYQQMQLPLIDLMLAAREPLPLQLASGILGWGVRDQHKVLEPLGSLCRIENGRIGFFHKSLNEWLVDGSKSGPFCSSVEDGRRVIASALWQSYDRWRKAGSHLAGGDGWEALGEAGEAYALRHLNAHLLAAGRKQDSKALLQDFAFAMRRCEAGAHEAMIEDHLSIESNHASPELGEWKDMLNADGHLLRRSQSWWRPHRMLLQMSLERAPASLLRKSAEQWRERNRENWPWLLRERLSKRRLPGRRSVTDFGQGRAFNLINLDVWWSGPHAAVVSSAGEVLVFELNSGQQILRLAPIGPCSSIRLEDDVLECFHPDGSISRHFLSSGASERRSASAEALEFAAGDDKLVRTSRNGKWKIVWDGRTTLEVQALDRSASSWRVDLPENTLVQSLTVTDDGKRFAAGCRDGKVWYSASSKRAPCCLHEGTQNIYGVDITADGQWIATVGKDRMLRVWDVLDRKLWFAEAADGFLAKRVCLAPDGKQVVTAGLDGKLLCWDISSSSVMSAQALVTSLVEIRGGFSDANQWVASDGEGQIHCRSESGHAPPEKVSWQAHMSKLWDLAITPDGNYLATAGEDGIARVWHRETQAHLADVVATEEKPFRAVAISPDGRWFVVAGEDKRPQVHDLHAVLQTQAPGDAPLKLEVKPPLNCRSRIEKLLFVDDMHFLSADTAGLVRLWRVDALDALWKIDHGAACKDSAGQPQDDERGQGAYALAISKSGRFLACSGTGIHRGISLWNLADAMHEAPPELVRVLHGHKRGVHFLAFRDDDRHLVSASWDETIVAWDWRRSERIMLRLVPQLSAVLALADGERLAVATAFGEQFTLRFQNLPNLQRS